MDPLTASAERILRGHFGTRATLRVEKRLTGGSTSTVLRMRVHGSAGLPPTVVVKVGAPECTDLLFNDWAATELLTRLGGDAPIYARFYGGDRQLPLIVLEDLGSGAGSPAELVAGTDPDAATASLIDYIRTLARLHAGARRRLCRGDMNGLEHCLLSQGTPRVYDFGVAGYRHALTEGLSHRINWGCVRRLPSSVVTLLDQAYQHELSRAVPELMFNDAATDALARWHIFHVISRLPEALIHDRPRGAATLRQQTIAWIDAFAHRPTEQPVLPALGDTATQLAQRLRRLWPPETYTIPYFPAFAR